MTNRLVARAGALLSAPLLGASFLTAPLGAAVAPVLAGAAAVATLAPAPARAQSPEDIAREEYLVVRSNPNATAEEYQSIADRHPNTNWGRQAAARAEQMRRAAPSNGSQAEIEPEPEPEPEPGGASTIDRGSVATTPGQSSRRGGTETAIESTLEPATESPVSGDLQGPDGVADLGVFKECQNCPEMVVVPSGSYFMGSPQSEPGRAETEGPVRMVTTPRFAMAAREVTIGEFRRFIQATGRATPGGCWLLDAPEGTLAWRESQDISWSAPGYTVTDDHPVTCVTAEDAQAYVDWVNQSVDGAPYRLPTEAEWEFAARAGSGEAYFWGGDATNICSFANGADQTSLASRPEWETVDAACSDGYPETAPVGQFEPNAFGLYDVSGNVAEWVADCWNESYEGAPTDGSAWRTGNCRQSVLRGGSWLNDPAYVRAANRGTQSNNARDFDVGFRLARDL